jgi:hypothetical protein
MATTKKKPPARSRSERRFTQQARDEAFLRFNPERSTLRGALQDAADQLQQEVSTARGTAAGVRQVARESVPKFRSVYGEAQGAVNQGEQDLMAAVGGAPIAPAAARDATGAQRRLSESLAGALSETTARESEAQSGASFAINQAQSRFGRNVERVQGRLGDLSQEEGRFVSGRVGDLLGEQAKRAFTARQNRASRAVTKRGQTLSHEDRVASRRAAATKAAAKQAADRKAHPTLPGGVKARTPQGQTAFRDSVAKAVAQVKPFAGKLDRHKVAAMFLTGVNAPAEGKRGQPGYKPPFKLPAIDQLELTAALDVLYDGRISRATVAKLHDAGIVVKQMPYKTGPTPRKGGPYQPLAAAASKAAAAVGKAKVKA